MQVTQPQYTHRVRDFTSTTPRKALGIVRPVISPDGTQIAFAAVGDIYVMPVGGGEPVNLTKDSALDTDPAWSPDGARAGVLVGQGQPAPAAVGPRHEERAGRKVTNITTQPQGASFSPDGKRIVFFNVDGMWRVAADVGARRRHRRGHEDSRLAAAAGHADLVARRQAHRARRRRADDACVSAKAPTRS